jgi:hypothetical protein
MVPWVSVEIFPSVCVFDYLADKIKGGSPLDNSIIFLFSETAAVLIFAKQPSRQRVCLVLNLKSTPPLEGEEQNQI